MGQESVKKKVLTEKVFTNVFESDPRLTEQVLFIPELFSGPAGAEIKNIEKLKDSLPFHQMEVDLIDGINDRFPSRNDNDTNEAYSNSKDQHKKKAEKSKK